MINSLKKVNPTYSFLIIILAFLLSCNNKKLEILEFYGNTMGTTYSIKLINQKKQFDFKTMQINIDSILSDFNKYFSTYIDDSEVSLLNKNKTTNDINISSKLYNLLNQSKIISRKTLGAFDVTVGPLIDLWGFGVSISPEFEKPSKFKIDSTLALVGNDKYMLNPGKIKKMMPDVQFDFNAIAKGAGIDMMAKYLEELNVSRYLIEIGGEVIVSGLNQHNSNWVIGIANPDDIASKLIESISVSDVAIATSGTYENFFHLDDVKYSHIINPKNGMPIKHELVSATVIANSALYADALATSFMVMGYEDSIEWANSNIDIECYLVARIDDGEYKIGYSENFPFH